MLQTALSRHLEEAKKKFIAFESSCLFSEFWRPGGSKLELHYSLSLNFSLGDWEESTTPRAGNWGWLQALLHNRPWHIQEKNPETETWFIAERKLEGDGFPHVLWNCFLCDLFHNSLFLYDLLGDAEWDTDGYKTCKDSQLWCRIVKCRAKSHWCSWLEGLWISKTEAAIVRQIRAKLESQASLDSYVATLKKIQWKKLAGFDEGETPASFLRARSVARDWVFHSRLLSWKWKAPMQYALDMSASKAANQGLLSRDEFVACIVRHPEG